MLNLWMFIAVELHLFHNIVTVKKSTKGLGALFSLPW